MKSCFATAACFFSFGLTCYSCSEADGKVERKALAQPNATSHVFQLPLNALKDTLITLFDFDNQYENPHLRSIFYYYDDGDMEHKMLINFVAETAKDAVFGGDYFKKPNTGNDIYLHDFGVTWKSPLYQVKGKPLEYRAPFLLRLKSVADTRTRLVIEAENPVVINGITGWGPHGPIAREEEVPPTTVEEHVLLLYIAEKLNDKTVAPLEWPVQ